MMGWIARYKRRQDEMIRNWQVEGNTPEMELEEWVKKLEERLEKIPVRDRKGPPTHRRSGYDLGGR